MPLFEVEMGSYCFILNPIPISTLTFIFTVTFQSSYSILHCWYHHVNITIIITCA